MSERSIKPDWSEKGSYWSDLWDKTPRDQLYFDLDFPKPGTILCDDAAMFLACAMALKGAGHVSPNPMVGAVLLDRYGGFLGAGAHLKIGSAHAEVNALADVADQALIDGASIFVTLEPCAHIGRTPSCAHLLAGTNLQRVVYGLKDPNPQVNGQGHQVLENAGKKVEIAKNWTPRCEWLARVFIYNQVKKSVFTALKVASTVTGVIAGNNTKRLWITGERARAMGHFLRLEYDAIVIGMGTLRLDNPTLNVRHPAIAGRTPLRIVLDPKNELVQKAGDFNLIRFQPDRTLVVVPDGPINFGEFKRLGVQNLQLPLDSDNRFVWKQLKESLWDIGLRSLLIEGGAGLYQSALSSHSVDVIHWFATADQGQEGLKWPIEEQFISAYRSGQGVELESDRLLEFKL